MVLAIGLIFLLGIIISWLLTCGIIYLICLCFGLSFNWGIATGIWLIIFLLNSIISKSK